MRQSQLFTKTLKTAPADETSKNAQLLIRAGYVFKEMAGVYTLLPLGLKVVKKIEQIIREEMNSVGGVEMQTSALQTKEAWEKTNRWDDEVVDNWFKTQLKSGTELGLSFTNEEAYTKIMKQYISSYKDLPAYPYDFKMIFRNELRSKSGLLRGREFYWKALYSFSEDKDQHDIFFKKMEQAYKNIFARAGIGEQTYYTFASGGSFSKFSNEFQTICEAGEDIIYVDEQKGLAINQEVYTDEVIQDLGLKKEDLVEKKSIEVGNIFSLANKFSEPIGLTYKNKEGEEKFVFMGSYGIGLTRLMGTIVELFADEQGIVWPESVAPFQVHLISLVKSSEDEVTKKATALYEELQKAGVEVLLDDRSEKSAGEKFADSDLLGIPQRIVISEKSLSAGGVEIKSRTGEKSEILSLEEVVKKLS